MSTFPKSRRALPSDDPLVSNARPIAQVKHERALRERARRSKRDRQHHAYNDHVDRFHNHGDYGANILDKRALAKAAARRETDQFDDALRDIRDEYEPNVADPYSENMLQPGNPYNTFQMKPTAPVLMNTGVPVVPVLPIPQKIP